MTRPSRSTHRRLGRPRHGDSASTRAALVAGARQCFATYGYDATTNKAIADAAGVTPGAIYHYFPSKADVYIAVFLELQHRFQVSTEAAIRHHQRLIDRYCALLDDAVALNCEDPTMSAFFVASPSEFRKHPELRQRLAETKVPRNDFLSRLAHDAVDRGEMGRDVNAQALEDLMNVVLSGLAGFAHLSGDPDRHRSAVEALKRFLRGELASWEASRVAS
jgi:AcrR family transcriptional regulator